MIAAQQETQQTVAQSMLQGIVEAIGDRPGDTAAQRDARSRDVVNSVLGLQPRDSVEIMLAGMAVTHVHLIQDSARDVMHGQEDLLKARTKSTIVALDRGMVGFLKELRLAQTRPVEASASAEPLPGPIAAPVIPSDKPKAEVAHPQARPASQAPFRSPVQVTPPEPPTPLLSPLRRADTSIAATMAVLSPPTTPRGAKPAVVTSPATHGHPLPAQSEGDKAKQERTRLLDALEQLATNAATAPKDRGIVGYVAPAVAARGSVKSATATAL